MSIIAELIEEAGKIGKNISAFEHELLAHLEARIMAIEAALGLTHAAPIPDIAPPPNDPMSAPSENTLTA